MKLLTLAITLLLLLTATYAPAEPPPPPGETNGTPPDAYFPIALTRASDGVIYEVGLTNITWYNLGGIDFVVYHSGYLVPNSWTNIGWGYDNFVHDNPEGFYRVVYTNGYTPLPDMPTILPNVSLDWMDLFDPYTSNVTVSASAPYIAEFTRTANAGDTIAYSADTSNFVIHCAGYVDSTVAICDFDGYGALTIPDLIEDELYMLWPVNNSYTGTPVAINKTESWWCTSSTTTGGLVSIYGRNLLLGSTNSYLYCLEEDEFLISVTSNPYKADFIVPDSWTNGIKTIYAHNGKGRAYGWADPLTVSIGSPEPWDSGTQFTNTDYASISAAIAAADASDWSTLIIGTGTHTTPTELNLNGVDKLRIIGAGMDSTTIKRASPYTGDQLINGSDLNHVQIRDLKLEAVPDATTHLVNIENANHITFDGVWVDQSLATVNYINDVGQDKILRLNYTTNTVLSNCRFTCKADLLWRYSTQLLATNNTFLGRNDTAKTVTISRRSKESHWEGNTWKHYDYANWGTKMNRCFGRGITGYDAIRDFYYGDNVMTNFAPYSTVDKNVGEHIMFEFGRTAFEGSPTSTASNTVTFSSDPNQNGNFGADMIGEVIFIQTGRGRGQNAIIESIIDNTVYIDGTWDVIPDTDSYCLIGEYSRNIAIYDSLFDGHDGHTINSKTHYNSVGVHPYAGTLNMVIDGNRFTDMRYPVYCVSLDTGGQQPVVFNLMQNNTGSNNRFSFCAESRDVDVQYANVYRKNDITNNIAESYVYRTGSGFDAGSEINMTIFQDNSAPETFYYIGMTEAQIVNQVFVTNGVVSYPED